MPNGLGVVERCSTGTESGTGWVMQGCVMRCERESVGEGGVEVKARGEGCDWSNDQACVNVTVESGGGAREG